MHVAVAVVTQLNHKDFLRTTQTFLQWAAAITLSHGQTGGNYKRKISKTNQNLGELNFLTRQPSGRLYGER